MVEDKFRHRHARLEPATYLSAAAQGGHADRAAYDIQALIASHEPVCEPSAIRISRARSASHKPPLATMHYLYVVIALAR